MRMAPTVSLLIPVPFPDNKHPPPSAHGNESLPLFAVYAAFIQLYLPGWAYEFDLTNLSIKFSCTPWWIYCRTNMEVVLACVHACARLHRCAVVCVQVRESFHRGTWGSNQAHQSYVRTLYSSTLSHLWGPDFRLCIAHMGTKLLLSFFFPVDCMPSGPHMMRRRALAEDKVRIEREKQWSSLPYCTLTTQTAGIYSHLRLKFVSGLSHFQLNK